MHMSLLIHLTDHEYFNRDGYSNIAVTRQKNFINTTTRGELLTIIISTDN